MKIRSLLKLCLAAVFAVCIGVSVLNVSINAKAANEVNVSISTINLEFGSEAHSILIATEGVQWNSYKNDQDASAWKDIADNTLINGRTITEMNDQIEGADKFKLEMQPAEVLGFSFVRVILPGTYMNCREVITVAIKEGWVYKEGTANYVAAPVTYVRNNAGTNMIKAEDFNAKEVTEITLSENPNNVNGFDSYRINVNIGHDVKGAKDIYNTMYDPSTFVSVKLNGKTIKEWNNYFIARDARFATPATYNSFPQNSVDEGHVPVFCKPIVVWATNTGFQISIFNEVITEWNSLTLEIDEYFSLNEERLIYHMAEPYFAEVYTSVDIAKGKWEVADHSNQSHKTKTYTVYAHDAGWNQPPLGGCLNEYDFVQYKDKGGQWQMKYLEVNGENLYDINVSSDAAFGSLQPNITSGGKYAPVLVMMGADKGYNNTSYIQFIIPDAYPKAGATTFENHKYITVKYGFWIITGGVKYYVGEDVKLGNSEEGWGLMPSASLVADAKNEIDGHRGSKVDENYFAVDVERMDKIVSDAKTAIDEATTVDVLNAVVVEAKAAIDAVNNKIDFIANSKSEVEAYKAGEFNTAEEALRVEAANTAKTAIDNASSKEDIEQALNTAKATIDALKTSFEYAREAIADKLTAANTELTGYKATGVFREEEQAQRDAVIATAIEELKAVCTEADVNAIVTAAKTAVDALKTDAQYDAEEELANAKTTALNKINTKNASVDFDSLSQEDSASIDSLYKKAQEDVEKATDKASVEKVASDFEAAVDQIVGATKADDTEKKGCKSSVDSLAVLGLFALVACGIVARKRR